MRAFISEKLVSSALMAGALISLLSLSCAAQTRISHLVSFGDSWSDNTQSRAFTNPGPDGIKRTWTNYPAGEIGVAEPGSVYEPSLGGNFSQSNYAVAGSEAVTDSIRATTPDASTQVDSYLATYGGAQPGALYTIWAGGNDIMYSLNDHLAADPILGPATLIFALPSMISEAANQAADQVQKLLAAGATDVVVPNMIPYSLSPYFSQTFPSFLGGIVDGYIETYYNSVLAARLDGMRGNFPEANVYDLNWFALVNDVAAQPGNYGLIDGTSRLPAGADPNNYFWYDDLHPTSAGHEILADYAYDQIIGFIQIPEPSTTLLISISISGLCLTRSRRMAA